MGGGVGDESWNTQYSPVLSYEDHRVPTSRYRDKGKAWTRRISDLACGSRDRRAHEAASLQALCPQVRRGPRSLETPHGTVAF